MISVENLTYTIKGQTLLRAVNFSIGDGELVALLGANGAGKSTLLKLMGGEKKPSSGCIRLAKKPLDRYLPLELARRRATMGQQHYVSVDFTVAEVVMMGRYPHYAAGPKTTDHRVVDETMAICGIAAFSDRSILSLSGGEQQRVHLARVLAQVWDQPGGVLLMDEPVSAMDVQYQHQTLAILRALADRGYVVVTVLHDINLAAHYAHRLILLKNGRKLHDGTPSEVLTERNIYSVFSMDAHVMVNPRSLKTNILPLGQRLEAHEFNSFLKTTLPNHWVAGQNIS